MADPSQPDFKGREILTFSLEKNRIYLAFHACDKAERAKFLSLVSSGLAEANLSGDFEEL